MLFLVASSDLNFFRNEEGDIVVGLFLSDINDSSLVYAYEVGMSIGRSDRIKEGKKCWIILKNNDKCCK